MIPVCISCIVFKTEASMFMYWLAFWLASSNCVDTSCLSYIAPDFFGQ